MSDKSDFVTILIECGLAEKEAQLLSILNQRGPSDASTLTKVAKMSRGEVYRILKKLHEKKMVELIKEKPLKFAAISIEKAVHDIIHAKKEKIERIKQIRDELRNFFKYSNLPLPLKPKFNIIQGRPQILSMTGRICSNSNKEICILASKSAIVRDVAKSIDDILERGSKTGLKIRVLTNIDRENLESVKRFMQFSKVKHFPINEMGQLLISDDKETLAIVSASPSPSLNASDETAIWTNADCYAKFQKAIFDGLWRDAIEGEKRVSSLENVK
jgi:sugar-specific transcriptional regulator TrmB